MLWQNPVRRPERHRALLGLAGSLSRQEADQLRRTGRNPRQGWREAFARAGSGASDELLLDPVTSRFDLEEWTW